MIWSRHIPIVAIATVSALVACRGASESEPAAGHSHEVGGRTVWTDEMEVFFEVPPMVAEVQSAPWPIHVTRLDDSSPAVEGRLTVRFRGQGGQTFRVMSESPTSPGIFSPAPTIPDAGEYRLVVDLEVPWASERIEAGTVTVYAQVDDVPVLDDTADAASIHFSKEEQWAGTFEVRKAVWRTLAPGFAVSGVVEPAAGRIADVVAPASGILLAEANLDAPTVGQHVQNGDLLATLFPLASHESFAAAKAQVERLEREAARLERLFAAEAVAEKRLIEARHDLDVARAAFQAMDGSMEEGYMHAIRAPLAGVIESREIVPGAAVDVGDRLFTVVDPSELWLRLYLPAQDARRAGSIRHVSFTQEGSTDTLMTSHIVAVGSTLDPESRTLPVILAFSNPAGGVKIGAFVSGLSFGEGDVEGTIIPNEAIALEDGQTFAYVQTGGESFERRQIVLGATSGRHTLVISGVEPGEYVVIRGAYNVYLASLSVAEIGDHGHPH